MFDWYRIFSLRRTNLQAGLRCLELHEGWGNCLIFIPLYIGGLFRCYIWESISHLEVSGLFCRFYSIFDSKHYRLWSDATSGSALFAYDPVTGFEVRMGFYGICKQRSYCTVKTPVFCDIKICGQMKMTYGRKLTLTSLICHDSR